MEKAGPTQLGQVALKKGKKKQTLNSESDRQKQAEKKKRRLEKALANSAAIISELEKKKQKKREEQQRLDEEGARVAEAVALHVLEEREENLPEVSGIFSGYRFGDTLDCCSNTGWGRDRWQFPPYAGPTRDVQSRLLGLTGDVRSQFLGLTGDVRSRFYYCEGCCPGFSALRIGEDEYGN